MSGGDHPETLLTLPAAAELAGVHYMTAYRWVRTSRLKAQSRAACGWCASVT